MGGAPAAVLDANVLFPFQLRNLLLTHAGLPRTVRRLAAAGFAATTLAA